jgi:hypothetical protein
MSEFLKTLLESSIMRVQPFGCFTMTVTCRQRIRLNALQITIKNF